MAADEIPAQVLEGARRAFGRFGFHGASLERVAAEAGVARVTLHRRGWSKEALLAAMTARAIQDYRAALWPALTAAAPADERLAAALEAVCDQAEANKELLLATDEARDRVFHEEGPEALTRTTFTEPLERILRDGRSDGSLRVDDPVEMATLLFNAVGWTYIHLRTGHGWSQAHARDTVTALVLHGVAPGLNRR